MSLRETAAEAAMLTVSLTSREAVKRYYNIESTQAGTAQMNVSWRDRIIMIVCLGIMSWYWQGGRLFNLGDTQAFHYYQDGKYEQAIAAYSKILVHVPCRSDFDAYRWRGRAYEKLNQYDKALNDFTTAIQVLHDTPLLYISPDRLSSLYCDRGDAYSKLKDYPHAITDYSEALKLYPRRGYARHSRCLAYKAIGQINLAEKDAQELKDEGFWGYKD